MTVRTAFVHACLATFGISAASAADVTVLPSQLEALEQLVAESPDDFAGVSVDETERKIIVRHSRNSDPYRIREALTALKKSKRRDAEQSWSVEMRPVTRSNRQLEWTFDRMLRVEPWATLVRPVLSGWEIDVEENVVAVNVTAITPDLRDAARRAFGATVELRLVADLNSNYSRSNDYAPWYGGIPVQGTFPNAIYASDLELCTAGFPVSEPGGAITGLLTAGHCFGQGAAIRQPSDNEWVGGILAREKTNNGLDWALIGFGTSYGSRVWITESSSLRINNPQSASGVAMLAAQVGTIVCFNGARTGEKCNARISSMNSCQATDQFTVTCKLITVKSTDGNRIAQRGDSGGPVYRKMSNLMLPEGIIVAGNGAGTTVFYHSIKTVLKAIEAHPYVGGFGAWFVIAN